VLYVTLVAVTFRNANANVAEKYQQFATEKHNQPVRTLDNGASNRQHNELLYSDNVTDVTSTARASGDALCCRKLRRLIRPKSLVSPRGGRTRLLIDVQPIEDE